MADSDERWRNIGDAVTARARELAFSQADLVRASGVSDATVRRVMRGEDGNYRADRLAKISQALGWGPHGIERMIAGKEPDDVRASTDDRVTTLEREVTELREAMDGVAQQLRELREVVRALGTQGGAL